MILIKIDFFKVLLALRFSEGLCLIRNPVEVGQARGGFQSGEVFQGEVHRQQQEQGIACSPEFCFHFQRAATTNQSSRSSKLILLFVVCVA